MLMIAWARYRHNFIKTRDGRAKFPYLSKGLSCVLACLDELAVGARADLHGLQPDDVEAQERLDPGVLPVAACSGPFKNKMSCSLDDGLSHNQEVTE